MRHGNPHLDARLREARRGAAAAASRARRVAREVQAECQHREVLEAPYQRSEYFSPMPAIRVCRNCGLTEYGRYGSKTTAGFGRWDFLSRDRCSIETDYNSRPKLATEFAAPVTRDEIRRYMVDA